MPIVVAYKDDESEKDKGDLVEKLAGQLLSAQNYDYTEDNRNIRQVGVEIDLLCTHKTIKGQTIYVECKAYSQSNKIQSAAIDKLIGVRTRKKYNQAWLITTAPLGKDAKGIVDEIHRGEDSDKFAFYTPTKLIDALSDSGIIVSEDITKQGVINLVQNQKRLGEEAYLLICKYGYFWAFEYLKGGEPFGIIYADAKDGEIITDQDLLDNLAVLKSDLTTLNHNAVFDILAVSNEQIIVDDIKSLNLNPLYLNEINDLGIKVNHPKKQSLNLNDVYIYPDLEELNSDDKTIEGSAIANGSIKRAIIFGDDLAGKTTLGKLTQRQLDMDGHIALMLSASEIKNRSKQKFEDLLMKKFSHQYGSESLKQDMFKDALKNDLSDISLIIDDFESLTIKRFDWQMELFSYLKDTYSNIILLADSATEIEVMAKAKTREMLEGFDAYKILQLGHVKRDELIQKWISTDDNELQTNDEVLSFKLDISSKINVAVGSNFIPTYPFYVLTMIHLVEDGNKVRTQGSSYADLYNYFITHALMGSSVKPEDLDFYLTYLSYIAHTLLDRGEDRIDETDLQTSYEAYTRKMAIDKPFNAVHRLLVNAKILKQDNNMYSFSLSYCRYYFIAKYLSDNLDEPENQQTIDRITKELYKNENANIVIFLVHHSKNRSIINAVVSQARSQFEEMIPQNLSASETKKINALIKEEIKFGLLEGTPEENRNKELTQQDRYERKKKNEESESILDIFGRVNLAFKTIDVLGQIANNYYGSLDADSKASIIDELYNLGLRGLRSFLDSFDNYIDALKQYLEERTEEKGIENEVDRNNEVDKIIYGFMQLIAFAFLKRISDSVSSKNLIPTLDQVIAKQQGPTASIVDLAARLNFPNELSKNRVKVGSLHKELENNYLPRDLLKMFVLQHMYKFNISFQDKQSICAQLGIEYKGPRRIKPKSSTK